MKLFVIVLSIAAAGLPARAQMATHADPIEVEPVLEVPSEDYRTGWVQIGAFSVLADTPADGAHEIHAVFIDKPALETYLRDGAFAEGTKIVKEVWGARTEDLTTGRASYADTLKGRFVMVADPDGKLGAGPRFGDGWGWAFFPGEETRITDTESYRDGCLACHEPARDQGLIYLQGYPALRR
ncbi:cytochrome c, class I [Maritimibacter sp. 55A14]|uniref:cytochrome P460 family protein n=1 Tax=Maritimibacter sp. 55A14 TaxID=2174844 RepID=UPI000D60DDDB|nr:cytochrome P460 family protein [Maritimibacter sp. 55A14]PWE29889.1 cytochrome c, class I [Maritimibacter sp. 55A14]